MTFKLSLQRGFGRWWEHLGGEETCQFDKTKVKFWSVLYHLFTIRINNCKKYQKNDIIVALDDAMTILTTNLDNDLDNRFWQPIQTKPKSFLPDLENGACPLWSLSPERVSKKWVFIDSYTLKKAELHNQRIEAKAVKSISGLMNWWI